MPSGTNYKVSHASPVKGAKTSPAANEKKTRPKKRPSRDDLDDFLAQSPDARRASKGKELDARPKRRSKDDLEVTRKKAGSGRSSPATSRPSTAGSDRPNSAGSTASMSSPKPARNAPVIVKKKSGDEESAALGSGRKKKPKPKVPEKSPTVQKVQPITTEADEYIRVQMEMGRAKRKPSKVAMFLKKMLDRSSVQLIEGKARAAAESLGLTQSDLRTLRAAFNTVDFDGSGSVDPAELLEALQEARTPLTDGIFKLMDLDGNGVISFDEYVCCLTTYCLYSESDILRFVFDLFDVDESGQLDEKEVVELCKAVNEGRPLFAGNFATALQSFDVDEDGLIDFTEFCALNRKYPTLLYPAFRLQSRMQQMTLGERTWTLILEAFALARKNEANQKLVDDGVLPKLPVNWFNRGVPLDVRRILGFTRYGTIKLEDGMGKAKPKKRGRGSRGSASVDERDSEEPESDLDDESVASEEPVETSG